MKTIRLIYILLILVSVLYSCEGSDIDLDDLIYNKTNPVRYVIEGQVSNVSKKHHVFISMPGSKSGTKVFEGVKNAKVKITDGENIWEFKELASDTKKFKDRKFAITPHIDNSGVYESIEYFAAKEGETYTLNVEISGQKFTASETIPVAEVMDVNEYNLLKEVDEKIYIVYGAKKNAIWTTSNSEHYPFSTKENIAIQILGRINFFTQYRVFDAYIRTIDNIQILSPNHDVYTTVRRYTISDSFSDYIWAYISQSGTIVSLEQNSHPSNFNNKKISGYFSVINCEQYLANQIKYKTHDISYFNQNKTFSTAYKDKGNYTLIMNEFGACELINSDMKLSGSYELINKNQIYVYFDKKYRDVPEELHEFYAKILRQEIPSEETGFEIENPNELDKYAIFKINDNGSIIGQDGVVWM